MFADFLSSAKNQFSYYKGLGEKTMSQLTDEQLFWKFNSESNSIAMVVKHLYGNMLSRWTDFLTTDGEKDWRNRDTEFEDDIKDRATLMKKWNEGWDCLFNTLRSLTEADLERTIYIRNMGHSVLDAINRQLAHYPYHIGQIVFYAKMLKQTEWNSLSIPKNKSNSYNADKFSKERSIKNFTDDELKRLK